MARAAAATMAAATMAAADRTRTAEQPDQRTQTPTHHPRPGARQVSEDEDARTNGSQGGTATHAHPPGRGGVEAEDDDAPPAPEVWNPKTTKSRPRRTGPRPAPTRNAEEQQSAGAEAEIGGRKGNETDKARRQSSERTAAEAPCAEVQERARPDRRGERRRRSRDRRTKEAKQANVGRERAESNTRKPAGPFNSQSGHPWQR